MIIIIIMGILILMVILMIPIVVMLTIVMNNNENDYDVMMNKMVLWQMILMMMIVTIPQNFAFDQGSAGIKYSYTIELPDSLNGKHRSYLSYYVLCNMSCKILLLI